MRAVPHPPNECGRPLRISPHHAHFGQRQDLAQAQQLVARLHSGAEARDHAGIGACHVAGGDRRRRAGADRGEKPRFHQREGGACLRVGQLIRGLDGGQPAPLIASVFRGGGMTAIDPDGRINAESVQYDINWYRDRRYVDGDVSAAAFVDSQYADYAAGVLGPFR